MICIVIHNCIWLINNIEIIFLQFLLWNAFEDASDHWNSQYFNTFFYGYFEPKKIYKEK